MVLAAVSRGRREVEPGFPGLSRYTGPWWLSPRGEGTGEGEAPSPGKMVPVRSSPASPTPPALPGGDTRTFLSGNPHPARASWRGYPYVPLWQPPPRPRFALLPRPLPGAGAVMAIARGKPCQGVVLAVVFREKGGERARTWFDPGISPCSGPWWLSPRGEGTGEGARPLPGQNGTRTSLSGSPHPARACGAPPPPPPGGEGSAGDSRWEAVPGSPPGSPRAVDRGGYRHGGRGPGGSPPPRRCELIRPSPAAPTPPAPAALLLRPLPGARTVMAIPGGKPCPVLPRVPPVQWTAWWLSPWGEGTGEGEAPSPQAGTRTFLFKAPGPRPPEGGSTWDTREKPSPGMQPPG